LTKIGDLNYPFPQKWDDALSRPKIEAAAERERTAYKVGDWWIEKRGSYEIVQHRLMKGGSKEIFVAQIASFVTSLLDCDERDLGTVAKNGLAKLGFKRTGRGRPKGRARDHEMRVFVETVGRAIAETSIFETKAELQSKHGRRWKSRFREKLRREGWPPEKFDLIARSSPLLFAKHIAADEFRCSLDHITRALKLNEPA
jgi:hypothetical protein